MCPLCFLRLHAVLTTSPHAVYILGGVPDSHLPICHAVCAAGARCHPAWSDPGHHLLPQTKPHPPGRPTGANTHTHMLWKHLDYSTFKLSIGEILPVILSGGIAAPIGPTCQVRRCIVRPAGQQAGLHREYFFIFLLRDYR